MSASKNEYPSNVTAQAAEQETELLPIGSQLTRLVRNCWFFRLVFKVSYLKDRFGLKIFIERTTVRERFIVLFSARKRGAVWHKTTNLFMNLGSAK
jgi:hypothetical protein